MSPAAHPTTPPPPTATRTPALTERQMAKLERLTEIGMDTAAFA